MKVIVKDALLFLALICMARPALADTDYHCLNMCISNGKPESMCMPACTYNDPGITMKAAPHAGADIGDLNTHNLVETPRPAGNEVLLKPHLPPGAQPQKDYACVMRCVHDGMQYQLCNEQCASAVKANGDVDATGVNQSAVDIKNKYGSLPK